MLFKIAFFIWLIIITLKCFNLIDWTWMNIIMPPVLVLIGFILGWLTLAYYTKED
jgi:hypothetical protein